MIKETLIGDTIKFTWVSSGITPSALYTAVYDGSESLVNSVTMTSSGAGHYYSNFTVPTSLGFYVGEMIAVINALPYKRRIKFKAVSNEVD